MEREIERVILDLLRKERVKMKVKKNVVEMLPRRKEREQKKRTRSLILRKIERR